MSSRQFFAASVLSFVALSGCQPASPKSAAAVAESKPAVVAARHDSTDLPDTESLVIRDSRPAPDTLEQSSRDYAKQVEAAMKRHAARDAARDAALTQPAAPDGAAEVSSVKFLNPRGDAPPIPAPATQPAPVAPIRPVDAPIPVALVAPPTVTQTPARAEVPFNKDTPAVNVPLIVAQPRPLAASDDLAQRFAQQVKDYPQDVAAHLDWQLMQFLQGQSVPQLQSLSTLPAEDREILSALLDGLSNFRGAMRADNTMLFSQKIRPILETAERLRTQADLSIPVVALCTDVKGFGVYEPINPPRFEAGREHKVVVYCEVENFSSILDEQKRWQTKLKQDVVLYTEQGGDEAWHDTTFARPIVDYSRNRRHDFFIVKMIKLPATLTIGRYLLKVTVKDEQMNRIAENTTSLQILAQLPVMPAQANAQP